MSQRFKFSQEDIPTLMFTAHTNNSKTIFTIEPFHASIKKFNSNIPGKQKNLLIKKIEDS